MGWRAVENRISLSIAPMSIPFRRIFFAAQIFYARCGIANEKAAFGTPCEKKREYCFDIISESPPLAFRCLIANAHNKRPVPLETNKRGISDWPKIIEDFLVIEPGLRGEILKGR